MTFNPLEITNHMHPIALLELQPKRIVFTKLHDLHNDDFTIGNLNRYMFNLQKIG